MRNPQELNAPASYRLPWRDRMGSRLGRVLGFPWVQLVMSALFALLLGQLIVDPHGRVLKALAGIILFVVAYRTRPLNALCFIAVLWMFPFSLAIGESTVVLVGLVTLVYLGRLLLRQVPPITRTPVDVGVGLLAAAYLLSFYNIEDPVVVFRSVQKVFSVFGSFLVFYFTATFVRSEEDLRRLVRAIGIALALAVGVGFYELFFPGHPLVPGWILENRIDQFVTKGLRVGGPYQDYELFGEFMALGVFLTLFMAVRARTPNERFYTISLAVLCMTMLLATVTRGAIISFAVGGAYLLWAIRKRLTIRGFVSILLVAVGAFQILEFLLVNFTRSGSIIKRLMGTYFIGIVPDSRAGWPELWARAMEHPFFGHGAYYDLGMSRGITGKGLYIWTWPHNQYIFYAHTVGLFGLGAFIFIVLRLLYISGRTKGPGLSEPSYARSLMVILHVMLVTFLTDQYKIDYLRNPTYQYFPWLMMGLIVATYRVIKDQEATPPASP